MKVLVTGASGLIGRELSHQLLSQGSLVFGVDVRDAVIEHKNYFHSNDIQQDIYDRLFCFSGYPCPSFYLQNPAFTMSNSVSQVENVLKIAAKYGSEFIFTSSSEVYEDANSNELMQEDSVGTIDLLHPRSCYKELKRYLEVLVTSYHRQYGFPIKIVRVFNSYGPCHDDDTRIINRILYSIRTKSPFIVYGDGSQRRSYCYVTDTVKGILLISSTNEFGPINIGNPYEEYSVTSIISMIEEIFKVKLTLIYVNDKKMLGPVFRKPDIHKAQIHGFNPKISLREGLIKLKTLGGKK